MTITIKFNKVAPIVQSTLKGGITAYFRGYKVGKVSRVALSADQKNILFYLEIYYKNLKLPENINIFLKTEDFFSARYFSLDYPENPSKKLLVDGDIVKGAASYERLDKYLVTEFETGKLKKIVDNSIVITDTLKNVSQANNKEFLKQINSSSNDIKTILESLKEVIADPQVKQDIKSTIKYSSKSLKHIDTLMNSKEIQQIISKAPQSIDKTVKNLDSINQNIPKINDSIIKANQNIPDANKAITATNSLLGTTNCNLGAINSKVPAIPPELLSNADKSLTKLDCLTNELTKIMGKRFLLFRLMFGNPGKDLGNCNSEPCKKY